jgi:hypothetical protein
MEILLILVALINLSSLFFFTYHFVKRVLLSRQLQNNAYEVHKLPTQNILDFARSFFESHDNKKAIDKKAQDIFLLFIDLQGEREKIVIKNSFLYGYQCAGKTDTPELLAEVYYKTQWKGE